MTTWERWVRELTDGAPSRTVAEMIGKSHSTAQTWMSRPTPQSAILLAIAYHADPIEALTVAGFLSSLEDLDVGMPDPELQGVASVRLTAELYRRAREAERRNRERSDPFDGLRPDPH